MAKNKNEEVETETVETEEAPKTDNRHIRITDPATGEEVKRVDWIREVYTTEGGEYYGNRGAIARKLTELQGKKVPYQIVFAATRDLKDPAAALKASKEEAKAAEAEAAAQAKAEAEAAKAAETTETE